MDWGQNLQFLSLQKRASDRKEIRKRNKEKELGKGKGKAKKRHIQRQPEV